MRPSRHFWPAVWMITCHPTGELREEQTYPLWFTEWNLRSSPDRKHRWDLKHTIKLWGVSVSKAKAHRRVAKTNVNVSLFNWALTAMRKKNCDVSGAGDRQLLRVWTKSINKTQKWDQSTHWIKDEKDSRDVRFTAETQTEFIYSQTLETHIWLKLNITDSTRSIHHSDKAGSRTGRFTEELLRESQIILRFTEEGVIDCHAQQKEEHHQHRN